MDGKRSGTTGSWQREITQRRVGQTETRVNPLIQQKVTEKTELSGAFVCVVRSKEYDDREHVTYIATRVHVIMLVHPSTEVWQ